MMSALDAGSLDGLDPFGAALDAIDVLAALANRILAVPADRLVGDHRRAELDGGLRNNQDAIVKLCFVADALQSVVSDLESAAERLCDPRLAAGGQ